MNNCTFVNRRCTVCARKLPPGVPAAVRRNCTGPAAPHVGQSNPLQSQIDVASQLFDACQAVGTPHHRGPDLVHLILEYLAFKRVLPASKMPTRSGPWDCPVTAHPCSFLGRGELPSPFYCEALKPAGVCHDLARKASTAAMARGDPCPGKQLDELVRDLLDPDGWRMEWGRRPFLRTPHFGFWPFPLALTKAPYPEITTRNLIYHVYASSRNDVWLRNVRQLCKRLSVFNGRRIFALAQGSNLVPSDQVQTAIGDPGAEYLLVPNDAELREVATFWPLLEAIRSNDPHAATFYAHTKGNANAHENPDAIRWWRNAMYHHLLDDPARVGEALRTAAIVGTHKIVWPPYQLSLFPSKIMVGHWMFAGTFFWFRHDAVFPDDRWRDVIADRYGAEAWPAAMFEPEHAISLFQPHTWPQDGSGMPSGSPYDPAAYRPEDRIDDEPEIRQDAATRPADRPVRQSGRGQWLLGKSGGPIVNLAGNVTLIFPRFLESRPRRVLELGPHDGRDTVILAAHCDELVALEGRPENVKQTRGAVQAAGLRNVTIEQADLETADLLAFGRFDCVWAVGILYHMPRPWELIGRIAAVTDLCLGWTHLAEVDLVEAGGYRGRWYEEADSRLAGLSAKSFWLLPPEFQRAWANLGWDCRFLDLPAPHVNGGLAAQFIAQRKQS